MTAATLHPVRPEEEGMRLDRWCRLRFPGLTNAYLNKLLRTGQVRLDGARVKANVRVAAGQEVRLPPLAFPTRPKDEPRPAAPLTERTGRSERREDGGPGRRVAGAPGGRLGGGRLGLLRHRGSSRH